MSRILNFLTLLIIKGLSCMFYSFDIQWVGERPPKPFRNIRILALLNHTSLFEPLYIGILPVSMLWDVSKRAIFPIADKTMQRPIFGKVLNLMGNAVPISRKRDRSWHYFMEAVQPESMIIILPEGRMMRANGLDKDGRPMTVRGGIADVMAELEGGPMLLAYSGGLHHVQIPGTGRPKLFKKLHIALEIVAIEDYKTQFEGDDGHDGFKTRLVADLEQRRNKYCQPQIP